MKSVQDPYIANIKFYFTDFIPLGEVLSKSDLNGFHSSEFI